MSYSGSFGSSGRLVLPPTKNKRATPHIPHKGSLHPPDQVQLAIRQLYLPLYEYLCQDGHRPQPSNSASMRKLQDLDPRQLLELMTDASDGQ